MLFRSVTGKIPLARREMRDLVSEELRRLDADEIYAESLAEVAAGLDREHVGKRRKGRKPGRPRKKTARGYGPMGTPSRPRRPRKGTSVPMTPSEEQAKSRSGSGATDDRPKQTAPSKKAPSGKTTASKSAPNNLETKKPTSEKRAAKRPARKRTTKKAQ